MKWFYIIISICLFYSCNIKKEIARFTKVALTSECPKNGTCTIQLFENKSIEIKQDEFGSLYYNLIENTQKKVIKYSYSKTVKGNLQDASYREEIVFEINNDNQNELLTNETLQNTKMLFGRFCYCKGQTGNYRVTQGKLDLNMKTQTIVLDFKIDEVPQIIKNFTFSLQ